MNNKKRYYWVDNVKVIAIALVALGHLFQSFVISGIMADSAVYQYFIDTIYYFHVPLFFLCSGFLYQRITKKQSAKDYGKNILKKLIALGIPYFVFLSISYLLKTIFADSVNIQTKGIIDDFFKTPMPPYWFLYALFFLFAVSPILKNKIDGIIRLVIAFFLYFVPDALGQSVIPRALFIIIYYICNSLIWFVIGMDIAIFELDKYFRKWQFVFFIIFLALSVLVYIKNVKVLIFLTLFACAGIVSLLGAIYKEKQNKFFEFISKYTMPIFLMHTIFSAGVRAVLFKFGISSLPIHIVLGLIASFVMPVIAGMIMEKIKLDFLYNPTKYIKIK